MVSLLFTAFSMWFNTSVCRAFRETGVMLSSVEHHVERAPYVSVSRRQCPDIYPQPAGVLRAHNIKVERSAFNGIGGDNFLHQHLQRGLAALRQPQLDHSARQISSHMMRLRKRVWAIAPPISSTIAE